MLKPLIFSQTLSSSVDFDIVNLFFPLLNILHMWNTLLVFLLPFFLLLPHLLYRFLSSQNSKNAPGWVLELTHLFFSVYMLSLISPIHFRYLKYILYAGEPRICNSSIRVCTSILNSSHIQFSSQVFHLDVQYALNSNMPKSELLVFIYKLVPSIDFLTLING